MRAAFLLTLALASPAASAPCGGDFNAFLQAMVAEAVAAGVPPDAAQRFIGGARQDPKVLKADRAQGVFRKTFLDFSQSLISRARLSAARAKSAELDAIFTRAEADYGVPRGVLLAFWTFETDLGKVQGDFNTRDALATLSQDCRRPEMFQPQLIAAAQLYAQGDFDPATTGAWAGEIGQVQMLPRDILERGVDGDGDGHVTLKTSAADALLSGANLLRHHGWQPGQPWLTEITLPADFDWALTGLGTEKSTADWAALGVSAREGALPAQDGAFILLPQGVVQILQNRYIVRAGVIQVGLIDDVHRTVDDGFLDRLQSIPTADDQLTQ